MQDGLIRHGLRNVALAGASLADDQRVLATGHELQGMQLETGLPRQLRVEGPVDFGERELLLESGLLVASLDKPRLAPVEFVLQDQREGLEERLLAALCLQHAGLERVAHARQA